MRRSDWGPLLAASSPVDSVILGDLYLVDIQQIMEIYPGNDGVILTKKQLDPPMRAISHLQQAMVAGQNPRHCTGLHIGGVPVPRKHT